MITLTPNIIDDLWFCLAEAFHLRLVDKRDSEEMALVGQALEAFGVMDQRHFLDNYATTIGQSVYLPFTLGEGNLIHQARTIAHEAQHGWQHAHRGGAEWAFKYLTDGAFRASQEAEAITTSCEVNWLVTGAILEPKAGAEKLRAYNVEQDDLDTVALRLRLAYKTTMLGGIVTESGKVCQEFFRGLK